MLRDTVSVYDFFNDPAFRSAQLVNVVDATPEEEALIRKAYGLLMATEDLIEAALCWAYGGLPPAAAMDCLRRQLIAQDTKISVREVIDTEVDEEGRVIEFCRLNFKRFPDYLAIRNSAQRGPGKLGVCSSSWFQWAAGRWDSGPDEDRVCLVIVHASCILHELLHSCITVSDPADGPDGVCGRCYHTYLLASTWMWAAFQRFPASLDSDCCAPEYGSVGSNGANDRRLFMSDCPHAEHYESCYP